MIKDGIRSMKLLAYKNRLMIFLFGLVVLAGSYNYSYYRLRDISNNLAQDLVYLENKDRYIKINNKEYDYLEYQRHRNWEEKQVEEKLEEGLTHEDFIFLRDKSPYAGKGLLVGEMEDYYMADPSDSQGYYASWNYQTQVFGFQDQKLDQVEGFDSYAFIFEHFAGGMVFAVILGFILMSVEKLTPYYRFTKTLPWSENRTYLFKLVFGSIILALMLGLTLLVRVLTLKNSGLSEIFIYQGFPIKGLLFSLSAVYSVFFLTMATGAIAGNILGQGAIFLIMGFFYIMVYGNTLVLDLMTKSDLASSLGRVYDGLPDLAKYLINPLMNFTGEDMTMAQAYLIRGRLTAYNFIMILVYILVGFGALRIQDGSGATRMVENKYISLLARWIIIISSASVLYGLTSLFGIYEDVILGPLVYLVLLIIFRKIYAKLFDVSLVF